MGGKRMPIDKGKIKLPSRRAFLGQLMSVPFLSCIGQMRLIALSGMDGRFALLQEGQCKLGQSSRLREFAEE
jgi:hypothetical protein